MNRLNLSINHTKLRIKIHAALKLIQTANMWIKINSENFVGDGHVLYLTLKYLFSKLYQMIYVRFVHYINILPQKKKIISRY